MSNSPTPTPGRAPDARPTSTARRVMAASLVVIVVALLVGVTVIAVKFLGPQQLAAVTASSSPSAAATPTASPTSSPPPTATSTAVPSPTPTPTPAGFNKSQYSIDDPNSIWVVVNKLRPIADGADFVPPNLEKIPPNMQNPFGHSLRTDTIDALQKMFDADQAEIGTTLVAQSGYRSFSSQTDGYNGYVQSLGQAGADATSARPGFSEHQTGLAIDILDTTGGCSTDGTCFGDTSSGKWLAANAYRFGFILRYPADKTAVTGYEYEPWHFRYVGVDLATEMHNTGIETLEEFFGLPPAPDYAG
ncbi:M15 family metallopeptidase [Subtercola endophyticus]|uniref:M15 family metallopeptidase n=1 Tax=Subtercola endophyticus TaxID=2895559 RepID=UPI001E444BED|nr:M15 family metallopeptidase [Subtercola endophyticus]UFS58584.1 M15 family metallopeptidase [Subtercola endophyticus]